MPARLTPFTLLLLTLAGWALVSAVVALAGLGGRYGLHPDDPALVPPLPDTRQVDDQAVFDYTVLTEASERPLFSVDRRPAPVNLAEGEAVDDTADLTVTSIILTPQLQAALVRRNGSEDTQRVRVGEDVPGSPGWRLLELQPRLAVFDGPDGRVDLELRVFDGQGGEAPTRVATPNVTRAEETSRRAALQQRVREARERAAARGESDADGASPVGSVQAEGTPTGAERGAAEQQGGEAARREQRQDAPQQEMTPEEQAEAIRQRIEERREQLRQRARRSTDELE
ncbi:hypothetical protein [Alkalisalibacterium limincola]|uniref:General secretion pathway protein GspN n=1 Tax=Alkalisalibacterium limincola TaxID=2699169 RepID=A0A5C8KX93_9GAMM|nr:hypothetical protein [Alkalisalibacterium limincola]TXK64999.1 hypothetical protein FU658_04090 [Alkalisalibacterium limincola]